MISPPWPEAAAFLALAGIYLYNSLKLPYPLGYAGLYSSMTELLAGQPFPMPSEIPYYGPGGVAFAYPPLGTYLASFFVGPLRVPMFAYLKWAPPVMTLMAMAALYLFARQWSGDRMKALAAVVVVSSAEITYAFHATASGMVRALALLWALLGAYFALKGVGHSRGWLVPSLLAGLFLALTAMTHLAYAAFLSPGIALMALFTPHDRPLPDRLKGLAVICFVGLTVSAAWWLTVVSRYGYAVFAYAGQTHGNMGLLSGSLLGTARELLRWFANFGRTWWPPFLSALGLAGFAYSIVNGRWLLPLWMVITVIFIGQADRFQIILAGLLVGELVVDISRLVRTHPLARTPVGRETLGGLAFLGLVLGPVVVLGSRGIQWTPRALSDDLVETARWVGEHTDETARYLYLGESPDEAEWFPYLAGRTPAIGPWGAEWNGDYERQLALTEEMEGCLGAQPPTCLDDLISRIGTEVDALVVQRGHVQLIAAVASSPDWQTGFENDAYAVYLKRQ